MTRLYLRIFLYFWLVILLTLAISGLVSRSGNRADLERARVATLQSSLDALAAQATVALTNNGEAGLVTWLRAEVAVRPEPALLVVAPDNTELLGRPLPGALPRFLDMLRRMGARPAGKRGPFPVRVLQAADGTRYLLFVPPPSNVGSRWLTDPAARRTLWLVLLMVSGAVCFFLARYLTRPVRALREAGSRIAAGDLSARVGPVIGKRRDELGALAREFDRMAGQVERLVEQQQELLRDVSHELRSPLARLQAAVGLIRQQRNQAPDADLDRIERESERLNALIGQILAYSRLQALPPAVRTALNVRELAAEVVSDANYEAQAAGKRVTLEPGTAALLAGDESLLRSALDNVVRNAVEHARSAVHVEVVGGAGRVALVVTDDGPGVPPEALPRLFKPFFQVPGCPGRGSGLGLAIAHRAMVLHGGSVGATVGEGHGLVVRLELPTS